ncbi:MAG: hypothetical protein SFV81_24925 [Pirellulaceae bacterium]|nr:hypothetical protein [Pirellulaceae bacterium]
MCFVLTLALAANGTVHAHFPWIVRDEDGKANYFFGENIAERTYKMPPSIAAAELNILNANGDLSKVEVIKVENDSLVGLQTVEAIPESAFLVCDVTFGIYHGARLSYSTMLQGGSLPTSPASLDKNPASRNLFAQLIDTDAGVEVIVTLMGKPLEGIEVHLYCSEGHEEGKAKTDASGKVTFADSQVEAGLNAIMLGHNEKRSGTFNNTAYEAESHYLTVSFYAPEQPATKKELPRVSTKFSPLPFTITSFGAARVEDALYVYGGHTGEAHSYSNAAQSNKLLRLDLSKPNAVWDEVAEGERQQGLGMVAYNDEFILVGGFTAKNNEGEKHDLHSLPTVRSFNYKTNMWCELPRLPEPRSSHDAALVGNTLYVVGGWKLSGEGRTTWHDTAWSMDLSAANRQWVAIANPPFKRRAVATVEHQGKLFVIGGMSDKGGPTKAVSIYDPATQSWSEAAELIGEKAMAGFGASGWSIAGKLIVTTYEGDIEQWDDDSKNWKILGKSNDARFFHRLLPITQENLIAIGGANMESGKFLELEVIHAN